MKYKYLKYLVKKEGVLPIHIILEVTSACNARCLTCFNWQKTDFKTEKRMSLGQFEKIFKSLKNLLWLSLTGGEPFLRDDLPEIIKLSMKYNDPEFVTTPTNCLLPDKVEKTVSDILVFYKKDLVITLSLDGIGDLHDKIRGVKGNFENFLETYKKLKQVQKKHKNLHIGVNTVVNSLNQEHFKEIYRYVKENLDVESHTFEVMRGCSRSSDVKAPSIEFYKENKEFFKKIMKDKTYYKTDISGLFMKAAKLCYHDISFEIAKQKK
ncbi:radical SAM protein [Nanoarchaeota archaeon]